MDNLPAEKGVFRNDVGAIFNMAGVTVYVSPPPKEILVLINKLLGLNLIIKSGKTKGSFYKVSGRSKINL